MCTGDDEVCRLRNIFCKIKYIVFKIKILTSVTSENFSGVLEMMFLKLNYAFALFSFFLFLFFFGRDRVRNFRCFPTKLNIFLTNPNDNFKNRCHSKRIHRHAVFQLLFESNFSLKLCFLLNNSIRLQWLLFHLIKARAKYKQVTK